MGSMILKKVVFERALSAGWGTLFAVSETETRECAKHTFVFDMIEKDAIYIFLGLQFTFFESIMLLCSD